MAKRTARERRTLVHDAGLPTTSPISTVAGVLVAIGAVAVVGAVIGAVGNQLGFSSDGVSTSEWRNLGIGGAVAAAVVLFTAFFFGGYTAGRMGRRAGFSHGLAVFALTVIVVAVVVGLTAWSGGVDSLRDNLADNGVPTDADTWSGVAIGALLAGVAAVFLGSVLGAIRGERWHGRIEAAAVEARTPEAIDLTQPRNQPSLEAEREDAARDEARDEERRATLAQDRPVTT
jgi:MFS family permease